MAGDLQTSLNGGQARKRRGANLARMTDKPLDSAAARLEELQVEALLGRAAGPSPSRELRPLLKAA